MVAKRLPLWVHSFRRLSLSGVPGRGFPFLLSITRPKSKEATPELFPEQGKSKLKTKKENNTYSSIIYKSIEYLKKNYLF